MSQTKKAALWALFGWIVLLRLTDAAFAAAITGITTDAPDAAVTAGIGTFWAYLRFIIPVIGVAAIIFGLWNAITTDRGQSSSVVSGLTAVGVGFVMVFVPVMITSGYTTSGSQAASLSEAASALRAAPPIDWGSPVTLLMIFGYCMWRMMRMANRRRSDYGNVARVSNRGR